MKTNQVITFLKKYFKGEKKLFIIAFILAFISSCIGLTYGYLMGLVSDQVIAGAFSTAIYILIIYLSIGLLDKTIFSRLSKIYLNQISINVMEKIGYEVYVKVGLLPARAFEEKTSGELINRIVNDSGTITDTFTQIIHIGLSLLTTVIVFIYIFINSKILALEIIIYLIIFYFISKKYLPIIKQKQKEIQKEKDKCVAEVNETIRGVREIRALGIRKKTNLNIKKIINTIFNNSKKQMISEKDYNAFIYCLNNILEALSFITCIILVAKGYTSFGFFMAITYYIYKFMGTIENIMAFSTSYQKMFVSIERIDELISNKLYEDETFGKVNKTSIKGYIEFKDVTFKYSNEETNIFENLNLQVEPNKLIAIVGKSGQGKTSIFNLLLKYFQPNDGLILIDDIPLNDFSEDALRQNIAIIRQDPFLFNKTILENFKILDNKLTLADIRKACKSAQIDDYITSLPNQYNTKIGEGGVNLSGGQKQRIAIARALLKKSKIILFDEATSALDNENQNKIKEVMKKLAKDHTIIVVAHRLSTIIDADEILVVDKGRIVEAGTHKQLMKKSKIYQNLYNNEE